MKIEEREQLHLQQLEELEVEAEDDAEDSIPCFVVITAKVAYILNLFSGRRREGDLQDMMDRNPTIAQLNVMILSIDLVKGPKGDLTKEPDVRFWIALIRAGRVIAVTVGPPCETWSSARYRPSGPPVIRTEQ